MHHYSIGCQHGKLEPERTKFQALVRVVKKSIEYSLNNHLSVWRKEWMFTKVKTEKTKFFLNAQQLLTSQMQWTAISQCSKFQLVIVIEKKGCFRHMYSRFMIFYVYMHTSLIGLKLNWLLTSLCFKMHYLYFSYCCRNSSKRIFTGWCMQTMFWRNVPYSGQNMQQNVLNISHIGLHANTTLLERKQCNDYLNMWSEKMCLWFIERAMNLPFSYLIFTN